MQSFRSFGLSFTLVLGAAAARATPEPLCAGYPRLAVDTPAGFCVARLADRSQGLRFPRRIVEVEPGRYWITDMGSWEPHQGRLLELKLPLAGTQASRLRLRVLIDGLDRPHGLTLGPDRRVYVGEAGKIWRTPVADEIVPETVLDGLPSDGAHPLKEIVFGRAGRLYINVGSASDACRDDAGQQPFPCPEVGAAQSRAVVLEAVLGGDAMTLQSVRPYATGLRNSMALAYLSGPDVLLQAENSIDYSDRDDPPEELNVLADGRDYGWPYCVGARHVAKGYEGRADCSTTDEPAMLWPAHTAPLHLLAVPHAAATPLEPSAAGPGTRRTTVNDAQRPFAGQLFVAWHGFRPGRQGLVSFQLDADGRVSEPRKDWIGNWQAVPGTRRQGSPTGLTLDRAGRMFIVEDRNRTILMLTREPARASR